MVVPFEIRDSRVREPAARTGQLAHCVHVRQRRRSSKW